MRTSLVAWARQASRHPLRSCSGVNARWSSRATGMEPSVTWTLHFLQVPWPPHVESMAMPFQLAASNTVTPGGTRTSRSAGVKEIRTRPAPASRSSPAAPPRAAGASIRPSRR